MKTECWIIDVRGGGGWPHEVQLKLMYSLYLFKCNLWPRNGVIWRILIIIIRHKCVCISILLTMSWYVMVRVRSHWASNFASASASNSQAQMQMQSFSLNWVSNPFRINRKLSWKLVAKLMTMLVDQCEQTLMKWVWYPIERVTFHLCLRVTCRRRRKCKVTCSMWMDPYMRDINNKAHVCSYIYSADNVLARI